MNTPRGRSDELVNAWTRATARATPGFIPNVRHRRRTSAGLLAVVFAIVVAGLVGALAVGGYLHMPKDRHLPTDPVGLASTAVQSIASTPGVRYAVTITTANPGGTLGLDALGEIDLQRGRFSGTADAGGAPFMLLFGGPTNGSVVITDEVFVKTEAGPWERQPAASASPASAPLKRLIDPLGVAQAIRRMLDASVVDPTVRLARCGKTTCQVVRFMPSRQAIVGLGSYVFGEWGLSQLPDDLQPIVVDLFVDPSSGFPVRMETRLLAGDTTTIVALDLTRLDHAPSITPPIP